MRSIVAISTLILSLYLLSTSCSNNNNNYNLPNGIKPITIDLPEIGISISLPDSSRIVTKTSKYINIIYKDINFSILPNNTGTFDDYSVANVPTFILYPSALNKTEKLVTRHNFSASIQTTTESSHKYISICDIRHKENPSGFIIYTTSDSSAINYQIIKHIIYSINNISKQR